MKKFLIMTFALLIICVQASAMRLELNPEPICKIYYHSGSCFINDEPQIKSVVKLDEDFYFHVKDSRLGDKRKKNTVAIDMIGENEIYLIHNTAGADFYLIKKFTGTGDAIKILGKRDGNCVEYLDALKLREKYDIGWNFYMSKVFTRDNLIIFRYTLQDYIIDVECHWHAVNQKFYPDVIER